MQRFKNTIKLAVVSLGLWGCAETTELSADQTLELHGETQGTTYTVIIPRAESTVTEQEIDSLLADFDRYLNSYLPNSYVARFNAASASEAFVFPDDYGYFKTCLDLSKRVHTLSEGAFDPTVYPLIEGWGFMKHLETPLDAPTVDSLLQFVGFGNNQLLDYHIDGNQLSIMKGNAAVKLDFNAIAQGYSVDVVADYLDKRGITNYFVEIGGELRLKGTNREQKLWRVGIDLPKDGLKTRQLAGILNQSDAGLATSGNYRNFYEKDGKKYAHTLNPKTGYPVQHNLLSATVVAESAALADAFATVFMVQGLEQAKAFLDKHPELKLEVVLLYQSENGEMDVFVTPGIAKQLENAEQ